MNGTSTYVTRTLPGKMTHIYLDSYKLWMHLHTFYQKCAQALNVLFVYLGYSDSNLKPTVALIGGQDSAWFFMVSGQTEIDFASGLQGICAAQQVALFMTCPDPHQPEHSYIL